jgi:hypothetical protein
MNSVPLTDRSLVVAANRSGKQARCGWALSELKIRITREDIENSDHERRCGDSLTGKLSRQDIICPIGQEEFTDYNDIVPDHIEPKGMGGAWRDDHPDNIQASHWWCNGKRDQPDWDD